MGGKFTGQTHIYLVGVDATLIDVSLFVGGLKLSYFIFSILKVSEIIKPESQNLKVSENGNFRIQNLKVHVGTQGSELYETIL